MASGATLVIKILTDTAQASKGMKDAEKSTGRMAKTMAGVAGAVAGGLIVGKVVEFAKASGQAASDVEQSMGAIEKVFGANADIVKGWANTAADAVGLSKSQFGDMATVIGSQLKGLGIPLDEATSKTYDLVKMGADLAATYGGTTAQAVEALSATLRGETDPIEKYGVSIKQSTIQSALLTKKTAELTAAAAKAGKPFKSQADATKAAKDALSKMTPEALTAAKTQTTLEMLTRKTADAHGQFASEADTAAVAQQKANAKYADAQAALGQALLPTMVLLAGVLSTVAGFISQHTVLFGVLLGIVLLIGAAFATLSAIMTITTAITAIFGETAAAAWLAALGPIGLIIAAVIAIIAVIVLLWNKFPPFKAAVLAVWAAIQAGAMAVANFVRAAWAVVWPPLLAGIRIVGAVFSAVFGLIGAIARLAASVIGLVFRVAFAIVAAAARPVVSLIAAGFRAVQPVINAIANALRGPLASAFAFLGGVARSAGSVISGAFSGFLSIIHTITGAVESLVSALSRIKVPKISLPSIPGLGRSVTAPASVSSPSVAGRLGGTPRATSSSSSPVVININGAIDPESTARQIKRILEGHNRRQGLTGVLRPAGLGL
jgi:hypothetical protein